MKKIYLAGGISDIDRKRGQKEMAQRLRGLGFEVYAAAENDKINDKTKDPTPEDIYKGDVDKILECDIFIARLSGGNEDGTLAEIGLVAGLNEVREKKVQIYAYTTNERLRHPQFSQGVASAGFNHLVLGMIQKWGEFLGVGDLIRKLEKMR